jgi:hypothetical protein
MSPFGDCPDIFAQSHLAAPCKRCTIRRDWRGAPSSFSERLRQSRMIWRDQNSKIERPLTGITPRSGRQASRGSFAQIPGPPLAAAFGNGRQSIYFDIAIAALWPLKSGKAAVAPR